jgi:hypothetical protein
VNIYIQDGAISGHTLWSEQALAENAADGVIMSPFFTPLTPRRGQATAEAFSKRVRDQGGSVVVDATTHGVSLPGTNNWANYNTWDFWRGPRGDLSTAEYRKAHVEATFIRQDELGVQRLTPTVALDNPIGADADVALALADEGKAADPQAWQSLAGRRGFWLSADLDNYIGAIQQLRSPVWFLTLIRDNSDYPPDMTEAAQTAAFCRTVDSLSRRSRVVVCHADLFGLPAVAAGASSIGTGWHTKQRLCSPATFQSNDPEQVRRQAKWFTYLGLVARLHNNESQILVAQDAARAASLYSGRVADVGRDMRLHHLSVVQSLVATVSGWPSKREKVAALRSIYEDASSELDDLAKKYSRVFTSQRVAHIDGSFEGLQAYAMAEGIW